MRALLRPLRIVPPLVALLALAGCGDGQPRSFSGYMEGDLLYIGPQEAGRVTRLDVQEGTRVAAGSTLALLEDDVQQADLAAAQAALAEAEAKLTKARATVQRPEEIAILQASERRAAAALDLSRIELDRQKALAPRGASSQATLHSAQHSSDQNQASLDEVRRQIDAGRIASRAEDIAAAEASVRSAKANADAAAIRLARRTLTTPQAGQVQTLYYRVGELVPEGKPVASVLPPGLVKVRFFVPEAQLPQMKTGQSVTVNCDGCQPIVADISFIADSPEYTPPVIYSREERAKLVYLVEARPRDPALARPGQPVTVSPAAVP